MARAPIRLGALARVLDQSGRMALRDGTELRSLILTVPVAEPPALDPERLWRITVVQPPQHWWDRWLIALRRQTGLKPKPDWPRVRLVWEARAVFAQLETSSIHATPDQGDQ